jgi:hypothetical protein
MTSAYRLLSGLLLLVATSASAEEVGTIASVTGSATIGRGDLRTAAAVGLPVQLGDSLHTGADGKLRVVFRDDSVIDLGESSSLVVDQQVFNPSTGTFSSLMRLVSGRARSLVSEYYRNPGASYHVETPTAVAGVRGTTFLVSYYPDSEVTEVVGIDGRIEVSSVGTRARESVYINANEATTVERGQAPTAPETLDEQRFRQQIEGLDQMALGSIGNLGGGGAALSGGNEVAAPDKAPSSSGMVGQLGRDQMKNAGDVAGQPIPVVEASRGSLGVPF